MDGCLRLGCLGISLLSLLPAALVLAVTIAVGSLFTTLPEPFGGIGEGIRGGVGQAALTSALPEGVGLETIERDAEKLTLVFIAAEPAQAAARGRLAADLAFAVAGYLAAPFDPAPRVTTAVIRILPESGAKAWARLEVPAERLRDFLDGKIDWADLTGSAAD